MANNVDIKRNCHNIGLLLICYFCSFWRNSRHLQAVTQVEAALQSFVVMIWKWRVLRALAKWKVYAEGSKKLKLTPKQYVELLQYSLSFHMFNPWPSLVHWRDVTQIDDAADDGSLASGYPPDKDNLQWSEWIHMSAYKILLDSEISKPH